VGKPEIVGKPQIVVYKIGLEMAKIELRSILEIVFGVVSVGRGTGFVMEFVGRAGGFVEQFALQTVGRIVNPRMVPLLFLF
jgi:hypothetical protein